MLLLYFCYSFNLGEFLCKLFINPNHGLLAKQSTDALAFVNFPPWPLVSVSEIKCIIQSLKSNKVRGEDFLLPEVFKIHIDWSAHFAGLFSLINNTSCIPVIWELQFPYIKRGKRVPQNYRPIHFIGIVTKMQAK